MNQTQKMDITGLYSQNNEIDRHSIKNLVYLYKMLDSLSQKPNLFFLNKHLLFSECKNFEHSVNSNTVAIHKYKYLNSCKKKVINRD